MTGYRIGKVRYQNFGPYADVEVDFSQPGLTVIEGTIHGKRGCDSNGSGKSYLFDGPAWALYDRCIREKYRGDDVVRLDTGGPTSVIVDLIGGADTVSVERYRKHPRYQNQARLVVGGKDITRGTNAQTNAAIEAMVGMDYLTFVNSIAFGAREDIKSFFSAPDSERKRILENILGLELYADALKVVRRKIKVAAEELDKYDERIAKYKTTIEQVQETRAEMLASSEDRDGAGLELQKQRLSVRRLKQNIEKKEGERDNVQKEAESASRKLEVACAIVRKKIAELDNAREEVQKRIDKTQSEISEFNGEIQALERRIKKFEKLKGICDTCETKVKEQRKREIIDKLQKEKRDLESKITIAGTQLLSEDSELEEIGPDPDEPESPELEDLEKEVEEIKGEIRGLEREHVVVAATYAAELKAYNEFEAVVKSLDERIETAEEKLRGVRKESAVRRHYVELLEFWDTGFGNSGVKSFLIEAEIPEINQRATGYAQQLLGAGATVRLCATKQLKTKKAQREELTIEGAIPGCTKSYAGASKGQKKRMDLALILAFRDIVASRSAKPFRQLFADEIFDGMDRSGVESIADLLKDLSSTIPVALITHDARLRAHGDRAIMVEHDGTKAKIKLADSEERGYTTNKQPAKRPASKRKKRGIEHAVARMRKGR